MIAKDTKDTKSRTGRASSHRCRPLTSTEAAQLEREFLDNLNRTGWDENVVADNPWEGFGE